MVLFYAGDDDTADERIAGLIRTAGFDPVKTGNLATAIRFEMFGDLHQAGGLRGRLLAHKDATALL